MQPARSAVAVTCCTVLPVAAKNGSRAAHRKKRHRQPTRNGGGWHDYCRPASVRARTTPSFGTPSVGRPTGPICHTTAPWSRYTHADILSGGHGDPRSGHSVPEQTAISDGDFSGVCRRRRRTWPDQPTWYSAGDAATSVKSAADACTASAAAATCRRTGTRPAGGGAAPAANGASSTSQKLPLPGRSSRAMWVGRLRLARAGRS